MFRVQRECMYPKPAKDVSQVKLAIMQWEEKRNAMISEFGKDAKIPDSRRVSPLLGTWPKDVKAQMMMPDEIGLQLRDDGTLRSRL